MQAGGLSAASVPDGAGAPRHAHVLVEKQWKMTRDLGSNLKSALGGGTSAIFFALPPT